MKFKRHVDFINELDNFKDLTWSRAFKDDILESIFNYFNLPSEGKGFDNSNIVYEN